MTDKSVRFSVCATGEQEVVSVARQWRKQAAPLENLPYSKNPAAHSAPLRLCHWRVSGAASWGFTFNRANPRQQQRRS